MWMCLERERGDGGPVYEWNDLYRTKDAKKSNTIISCSRIKHADEDNSTL